MNPKDLLRKLSSVSAAAAALAGLSQTQASTGGVPVAELTGIRKHTDAFEPLILKPAPVREMTEQQFAGHRSHSSHRSHYSSRGGHSSHSSHYSSSTYSAPSVPSSRAATPRPYSPPPTTFPSVPTRVVPQPAATRAPLPRATPAATPGSVATAPTRIELTNGAILFGTVLVKSPVGISFKTIDGKTHKIPRILLSAGTISALGLPPEKSAP